MAAGLVGICRTKPILHRLHSQKRNICWVRWLCSGERPLFSELLRASSLRKRTLPSLWQWQQFTRLLLPVLKSPRTLVKEIVVALVSWVERSCYREFLLTLKWALYLVLRNGSEISAEGHGCLAGENQRRWCFHRKQGQDECGQHRARGTSRGIAHSWGIAQPRRPVLPYVLHSSLLIHLILVSVLV